MRNDEHKQKVKASFDMASGGYDCHSLRFFAESASWLVRKLQLKGDENLLDVATGTGHVAIAAARELRNGSVTGIDLSGKMLEKAAMKAASSSLQNVTFRQCDIENLGSSPEIFDAASCAFGLFFLPDMEHGLKCISRVLRPGGKLAVTSFTPSLMMPLRRLLMDRIVEYGVEEPKLSWMSLDSPDKISSLLGKAGFADVQVESRQMGYYLEDSLGWRDVLWNSGYRGLLSRLSPEDLDRFMAEHLKEVDGVADKEGIWLEVEVLFATAVWPVS